MMNGVKNDISKEEVLKRLGKMIRRETNNGEIIKELLDRAAYAYDQFSECGMYSTGGISNHVNELEIVEKFMPAPVKIKQDDSGEIGKKAFIDAIMHVEKIKPASDKGEAEWKFTMTVGDRTTAFRLLNSQIINSHLVFENLFKSNFGLYLPYDLTRKPDKGEKSNWKKFMIYIEERCEETDPVECIEWIECDLLLDRIAGFKIVPDGDLWANKSKSKNSLFKKEMNGETYYLIRPDDIQQLVKDMKISTTIEQIGRVMNQRGYKRAKNPACRVKSGVVTAWWVTESCLYERGLKDTPLQNENVSDSPLHMDSGY